MTMNATLLMTDAWQPTVLRIVPFSNNNARSSEQPLQLDKEPSERSSQVFHRRGFPVLAVTRPKDFGQSDSRSVSSRSVTSARSDTSERGRDNVSLVSGGTLKRSNQITMAIKSDGHSSLKKTDRMREVDTPSEKDSMKFSVQNINEQVSSSSSLKSSEVSDSKTKDKTNALDNTRTRFPKPTISASNDNSMNLAPVNGVRRSVPLTPGELDLKRFRDSYTQEQAQRKKKYKLNVNQLPRSTTPINDHDPDKLNMKQVIAFLQTKATRDLPKKSPTDRTSPSPRGYRRSFDLAVTSNKRSVIIVDERSPSQQSKVSSREGARMTGTVSVMSTKSTPNLPYSQSGGEKFKSSMSTRSSVGRSRTNHSGSYKPMKEFRLYRFLAVAPTGKNNTGLTTAIADSGDVVEKGENGSPLMSVLGSQSNRVLRKSNPQKRNNSTANLLHRRAMQKNVSVDKKDETDAERNALIRLPNVSDYHDDQETSQSDDDTNSTTSATCNSTTMDYGNTNNDSTAVPRSRQSRITFSDEVQHVSSAKREIINTVAENDDGDSDNNASDDDEDEYIETNRSVPCGMLPGINPRMYKHPEFPRVTIQIPNNPSIAISTKSQLHVTMPLAADNKHTYSSEIVRLTLRQDKHATRVTSYMSDMQNADSDNVSKTLSMTSLTSPHSYRDNENTGKHEHSRHYSNGLSHVTDGSHAKHIHRLHAYNNE